MKTEDFFGAQLGFPIRCEICESINSIYHNVIIDHGVAILLDCNNSKWHERIRSIPVEISLDPSELVFAWKSDSKNKALRQLISKLEQKDNFSS